MAEAVVQFILGPSGQDVHRIHAGMQRLVGDVGCTLGDNQGQDARAQYSQGGVSTKRWEGYPGVRLFEDTVANVNSLDTLGLSSTLVATFQK